MPIGTRTRDFDLRLEDAPDAPSDFTLYFDGMDNAAFDQMWVASLASFMVEQTSTSSLHLRDVLDIVQAARDRYRKIVEDSNGHDKPDMQT